MNEMGGVSSNPPRGPGQGNQPPDKVVPRQTGKPADAAGSKETASTFAQILKNLEQAVGGEK